MDISDKYNEPDISDDILKRNQEVTVTLLFIYLLGLGPKLFFFFLKG